MTTRQTTPLPVTSSMIFEARKRIRQDVVTTPLTHSRLLSERYGCDLWFKFENLQFTSSFKERGALNKLLQLTDEQKKKGITTISAGNHALAVAYHASRFGIPATLVMPETAPFAKVSRVRSFGAEVILHGKTFAEGATIVPELMEKRGLTLVHPFNDEAIIAGQGTIGLEVMESLSDVEVIVVPIGGGGLIAGIAIAAKAINPKVKIIGVQTELYPSMAAALKGGMMVGSGGISVAEGIAVKEPGVLTRPIVEALVDEVLVVPEDSIEDAVAELLITEKSLCEGAGATGLAAVRVFPDRFKGKKTAVILCGGNIDQSILVSILHRSLLRQGRIVRFFVKSPDTVGLLANVANIIAKNGGNIMQVYHDRIFLNPGAKTTRIEFDVELQDAASYQRIRDELTQNGMTVE